jgi:hypothetical protein
MPLVGLGSVSDAVLRGAPCPVLLVRSNGTATTGPPPKAAEARAAAVAAEMTGGKVGAWCAGHSLNTYSPVWQNSNGNDWEGRVQAPAEAH